MKKLNNQGSTFVLALLVIMLLTTLSLALAGASLGNMTMKSIDRGSKKTFYTSETLLDEIRAGIGYQSVDSLATAYEDVLTNVIDSSSGFGKVVDNNTANNQLKAKYIDNILKDIVGTYLSFPNSTTTYVTTETLSALELRNAQDTAKAYISSYIKGNEYENDMATVTSIGHINAYKNATNGYEWIVIVKDVSINFKAEKNGEEYFSNITVDLEIEYPNMTIDFTTTNRLTDFVNYSLIADDSIIIAGQTVNVNASAYAGNIIDIGPSTTDSAIAGNVRFESFTDANINVVCGGDNETLSGTIRVGGNSTVASTAHFQGVNIWCTNIVTRKDYGDGTRDATAGANLYIGDACVSYVKDDLSVEGQKSNVTVAGEYYGYMFEGPDTYNVGHAASSAMIVNGKNSKVTIAATKMLLAGRAYVDVAGGAAGSYMTGESLSLRASQEVYLIPADFLGVNYGVRVTNPMSYEMWRDLVTAEIENRTNAEGQPIKICQVEETYFAKGYLGTPEYRAHIIAEDMVYVYWNFSSLQASKDYIKAVASNVNPEMKAILDRYTHNLFGGADSVIDVTTGSSSIDATGLFMESTSGLPGYTEAGGHMTADLIKLKSTDLENRYKIISHLLVNIPWMDGSSTHMVEDPEQSLLNLKGYVVTGNELTTTSIINNIIDMSLLTGNEYNPEGHAMAYGPSTEKYVKMAIKGDYTVPDDVNGGVIIATGSITINHNFHGMLLAGGTIYIRGDARLTTNANMVDEFITGKEDFRDSSISQEDVPFKQYFYAYKSGAVEDDSREEVKIESIDYKDLVNFNNWRKYEDN